MQFLDGMVQAFGIYVVGVVDIGRNQHHVAQLVNQTRYSTSVANNAVKQFTRENQTPIVAGHIQAVVDVFTDFIAG